MKDKDALQIIKEVHELDGCAFCLGERGGVPGNENIVTIDGAKWLACDYCTSDLDREHYPTRGTPIPRPGSSAKFVIEIPEKKGL